MQRGDKGLVLCAVCDAQHRGRNQQSGKVYQTYCPWRRTGVMGEPAPQQRQVLAGSQKKCVFRQHYAPAIVIVATLGLVSAPAAYAQSASPNASFPLGPSTDPNYFPIGVWLQQPVYASQYKAIGVNLYVGLDGGPTEDDLATLSAAGMKVICDQNSVGLAHINDPTIVGWSLPDEPDNAQWNGSSYDPPFTPADVQGWYNTVRSNDASRPVYLNLGQGVAWDGWYGRGTRTDHPEDYPQYLQSADIGSFDIYPMNSLDADVAGQIWRVGYGTARLKQWAPAGQQTWAFIEVCDIDATDAAPGPTTTQINSEVWQALVNGATGIQYFTHQFQPVFNDRVMLTDPTIKSAVAAINSRIASVAPALNSANIVGATSIDSASPVQFMEKWVGDDIYIFAVGSTSTSTTATITNLALPPNTVAEVLDEGRNVNVTNGAFTDSFGSYGVHLYRITQTRSLWNVDASGNWSVASNWSNGVPNGDGKRATLGSAITAPRSTTLDAPITLGSLRFQGTEPQTLAGTQTLTLSEPFEGNAQLDVVAGASGVIDTPVNLATNTTVSIANGGALQLNGDLTTNGGITLSKTGPGTLESKNYRLATLDIQDGVARILPNGTSAATSVVQSLTIAGDTTPTATLDLSDNALIVDYTGASPISTLQAQLKSGYAMGTWLGNGIISSSATAVAADAGDAHKTALGYAEASNIGVGSFAGQSVDDSSVLIRYTLAGDANLDGVVNALDFNALASNFGDSGQLWSGGDFNYDGIVNTLDFNQLAANFGAALPVPVVPLGTAVPEPTMLSLGVSAILLHRRRCQMRRRSH